MRITLLLLTFILIGCQDYNSNSADREKYGPIVLDDSDPNFVRAYGILQNRCMNCHNYHNEWVNLKSSEAWVQSGVVAWRSPETSPLIIRTVNTGQGGDMPLGRPPLPTDEYNHLLKWINELP